MRFALVAIIAAAVFSTVNTARATEPKPKPRGTYLGNAAAQQRVNLRSRYFTPERLAQNAEKPHSGNRIPIISGFASDRIGLQPRREKDRVIQAAETAALRKKYLMEGIEKNESSGDGIQNVGGSPDKMGLKRHGSKEMALQAEGEK